MSKPDFETWPESAQTKRVPQQRSDAKTKTSEAGCPECGAEWRGEAVVVTEQPTDQQRSEAVTRATLQTSTGRERNGW